MRREKSYKKKEKKQGKKRKKRKKRKKKKMNKKKRNPKVFTTVCSNPTSSRMLHNQDPGSTFDGVFPGPSELNGT